MALDDTTEGAAVARVGPARSGDQRFRPADRLLARRDFDRVLKQGRRKSSPELSVVLGSPGTRGRLASRNEARADKDLPRRSRLGITIGRKCGNAVVRNRFKRQVREWFRIHRDAAERPVDLVVIARPAAAALGRAELAARLNALTGWPDRSQVPAPQRKTSNR